MKLIFVVLLLGIFGCGKKQPITPEPSPNPIPNEEEAVTQITNNYYSSEYCTEANEDIKILLVIIENQKKNCKKDRHD